MSLFKGIIYFCFLAILTAAQDEPQLCKYSQSKAFDKDKIIGTWWEVATNPAPRGNWDCVEVDLSFTYNYGIQINITFSNTPSTLWKNQTMYNSIDVHDYHYAGYNISFINGNTNTSFQVYKFMETDYKNYIILCGVNATNPDESFGIILTRSRYPSKSELDGYIDKASKKYADFSKGNMTMIKQSPACYRGGANMLHSMLATLVAVYFALLHNIM